MSKTYRFLGGPNHGELRAIADGMHRVNVFQPEISLAAFEVTDELDDAIPLKIIEYERSTFFFPNLGEGAEVFVPRNTSDEMKEWYLIRFLTGAAI